MTPSIQWNPALSALPVSGIRRMFNLAATMEDVIHLSIGQPDFPTPPHIIEAHVEALRQDKTHYTLDAGLPELLSALVRYYGKFSGRRLVEENLLETTGAGEAIFLAVTSLAAPGREVIVIEPSFVLFQPLVGLAGGSVRRIVTTAEKGYQVDPQEVIDAMGPRTCAVILNSPGNPTGAVYPASTVQAICQAAARRGITVISDEVYDRLLLDEMESPSVLNLRPGSGPPDRGQQCFQDLQHAGHAGGLADLQPQEPPDLEALPHLHHHGGEHAGTVGLGGGPAG